MTSSLTIARTVDLLVHDQLAASTDDRDGGLHPFELAKARLYVVPLADDASDIGSGGAFDRACDDRIVLLDEDENPYRLLRRTRHHPPLLAGCLVATGWCAPFGLDDEECARAPSSHPQRQRVRLTIVITHEGIASVMRQGDEPDVVHTLPSRGIGDLPDVLEAWWRAN